MRLRRLIPRCSLRTLVIFLLLCGTALGLWRYWGARHCGGEAGDPQDIVSRPIPFKRFGKAPPGDFDLEIEIEVLSPERLRGKVYLDRRPGGPSAGVELRPGAEPGLFLEGAEHFHGGPRLPRAAAGLTQGKHVLVARRREGPKGLYSYSLEAGGRITDVLHASWPGRDGADCGTRALEGLRIVKLTPHPVADPLFEDPENGNFTLKPESPALKLGFKPIDTSKIGRLKTP